MKNFNNLFILLLVIVLIFSLAACTTEDSSQPKEEVENLDEIVENQFPLSITDFLERKITLEKEPERIASLLLLLPNLYMLWELAIKL